MFSLRGCVHRLLGLVLVSILSDLHVNPVLNHCYRSCTTLASQAAETADTIGEGLVDGRGTLSKEADRILQVRESPGVKVFSSLVALSVVTERTVPRQGTVVG